MLPEDACRGPASCRDHGVPRRVCGQLTRPSGANWVTAAPPRSRSSGCLGGGGGGGGGCWPQCRPPSPLRARHLCATPCASRAAPPHPAAPAQAFSGGRGGKQGRQAARACVAARRVPNAGDLAPVVICAAGCALRRVASASALPPLRPRAFLRRRLGPLAATSLCAPPTNLRRRLVSGVYGGAALLCQWLCAPQVRRERTPRLWL